MHYQKTLLGTASNDLMLGVSVRGEAALGLQALSRIKMYQVGRARAGLGITHNPWFSIEGFVVCLAQS